MVGRAEYIGIGGDVAFHLSNSHVGHLLAHEIRAAGDGVGGQFGEILEVGGELVIHPIVDLCTPI